MNTFESEKLNCLSKFQCCVLEIKREKTLQKTEIKKIHRGETKAVVPLSLSAYLYVSHNSDKVSHELYTM